MNVSPITFRPLQNPGLPAAPGHNPITETSKVKPRESHDQVCLTACSSESRPESKKPRRTPINGNGLSTALSELQRFNEREYYNETADAQARQAYYSDIDWSKDPGQLFDQLSNKVSVTHDKVLAYRPSAYLYPWVDLHPDGQLRSIYSAKSMDPATAIIEDWQIGQNERLAESALALAGAGLGGAETASVAMALDLQSEALNCEHVVPQSWFSKRQPDRGDLHHLFACEMRCNSLRSNLPFDELKRRDDTGCRDDCGEIVGDRGGFEPLGGKGAVARATLYYLLRYPDTIDNYDQKDVGMLLDWHQRFPVSLYEKHRNSAIEELQGNRNPLIDFPQMAGKIDFAKGIKG